MGGTGTGWVWPNTALKGVMRVSSQSEGLVHLLDIVLASCTPRAGG
jgi:hypothetical protein